MKIFYQLTGSERKALVAAISQNLNTPAQYLGAPTFAYQVGEYRIDKNGTVTGKDNLDLEDALYQKGFNAQEREYDEPDTYESGLGGLGATPSVEEMQEDAEAWAERQMRRLQFETENVPDYSNRGPYGDDDIPDFEDLQMTESDTLTIEMPLEGFTEENMSNLEKLIASKASLIKKALGIDALPIERTETTLRFPWFAFDTTGEDVAAYSRFIGALYAAAKKQQRVTAKEHPVENEKFAFRVFLIRLGFVGDDYKSARKILLRNLSGNSAFKVAPRAEEVNDHE